MRVLFIVTGIGYGESTREHAIINAMLKKKPGTEVVVAAYGMSYYYFKDKFRTIKIAGYSFPFRHLRFELRKFLARNILLPFIWTVSIVRLAVAVVSHKIDLIVSDFELFGCIVAKLTGRRCIAVFGYDPLLYKEYKEKTRILDLQARYLEFTYRCADKVIIPSFIRTGKNKKQVYIAPIVRTTPQMLPGKNAIMKKLKLRKEPIIVTTGGSTFGDVLIRTINRIAPRFNEHFIIFTQSRFRPARNVLKAAPSKDFLEYLKVSKGVITLAGQLTLSECIAFKKPLLVFPIKGHIEQLLNAYAIKDQAMIATGNIERTVGLFIKNLGSLRYRIPDVRCDGAVKAADIILKYGR